jgi:hypothetical protein
MTPKLAARLEATKFMGNRDIKRQLQQGCGRAG